MLNANEIFITVRMGQWNAGVLVECAQIMHYYPADWRLGYNAGEANAGDGSLRAIL